MLPGKMRPQTQSRSITSLVFCLALAGCGGQQTPASTSASPGMSYVQLSAGQKQLVDKGVRQMIKNGSAVRIVSMDAARGKTAENTNVCGYVRFNAADGSSAERRYFVRLGPENGTETTLMGQVTNSPANSAKVKFMCSQAGLK